jgi:dipeptidyl aminopeptidase/acylaminoacyl peptidase
MKKRNVAALFLFYMVLMPLTAGYPVSAADDTRAALAPRPRTITPEDYFDLASIDQCVVSPSGRFAAYQETRWGEDGKERDLWLADLTAISQRRLTFDGLGAWNPSWDLEERWIYVSGSRRRSGEDKPPWDGSTQIWRISPDGGEPFPVTRVAGGIGHFHLAADGGSLFYTVGEEVYEETWQALRKSFPKLEYGHGVSRLDSLWQLDLAGWRTKRLLDPRQVIHDLAPSPDGQRVALITASDEELIFKEGWSRVEVLNLADGELSTLTGPEWREDHPSPFGWIEELAWSEDSAALAFSISFDGYASRIYLGEWQGPALSLLRVSLAPEVSYAGGLAWRGKERTLCYRGESRARIRVHAIENLRFASQGEQQILTPGDVVVESFDFAKSGNPLVMAAGGPDTFTDLHLVAADGSTRRITSVNPQVEGWDLPQLSVFAWTGADDDTVEGILELPPGYKPGNGPLPLIVELHGGPTSATRFGLRFWIYGRTLMAANGYALISPNYHGSTGYGEPFLEKLIGRENEIEVTDIIAGAEALVRAGIADPGRIGVMGWSNGGYLVNCLITSRPEMFQAASSGAGILDMVIQWGTEDTPGHVINYMRGLPWERAEAYRHSSPLFRLDRVRTPTLIHVGGADPRVPPAHSRALYRALQHYLNVPTELVVYPGEEHSLSSREHRLAKMKWDLAWFGKYLPVDGGTAND